MHWISLSLCWTVQINFSIKTKFGLMHRVKFSIRGNNQHQTENGAELQHHFVFRIKPVIEGLRERTEYIPQL